MKTLEQIKDDYAYLMIGEDWGTWIKEGYEIDSDDIREIAQRYADEYAKEALRMASENAKIWCESSISGLELNSYTKFLVDDNNIAFDSETVNVYKQSILSEDNLPKHR